MGTLLEHRAVDGLIRAGRASVLDTYTALARHTSGARLTETSEMVFCEGPKDISYCNFVAGFNWAGDHDRRLEALKNRCLVRPDTSVFAISGDEPRDLPEMLAERGWLLAGALVQLGARDFSPCQSKGDYELVQAVGDARRTVAAFMARQFFQRSSAELRSKVVDATASCGLELWRYGPESGPIGAVMLNRQPDSLGIYNLCVDEPRRGQGHGADLMAWIQGLAQEAALPLVLQCDFRLQEWYGQFGFQQFGEVQCWRAPNRWP